MGNKQVNKNYESLTYEEYSDCGDKSKKTGLRYTYESKGANKRSSLFSSYEHTYDIGVTRSIFYSDREKVKDALEFIKSLQPTNDIKENRQKIIHLLEKIN